MSEAIQCPTWESVRAIIKRTASDNTTAAVIKRIRLGLLLSVAPGSVSADQKSDMLPAESRHTIEDVEEKLERALEIYRDGDSHYVIKKLIELCETDKVLLEAIMLPHKSYDKAFQYFFGRCRTVGYRMPYGNLVFLDNNVAVKLAVEYFKRDDFAEAKKKAENRRRKVKKTANKAKEELAKAESSATAATAKQEEMKKGPTHSSDCDESKSKKGAKSKDMAGQLSLFN